MEVNSRMDWMADSSGKERIARALDGMGCRRTRVVLTECLEVLAGESIASQWFSTGPYGRTWQRKWRVNTCWTQVNTREHAWRRTTKWTSFDSELDSLMRFFSAWAALYDKAKLDQMYRLEHNEQMLKYSQPLGISWVEKDRKGPSKRKNP